MKKILLIGALFSLVSGSLTTTACSIRHKYKQIVLPFELEQFRELRLKYYQADKEDEPGFEDELVLVQKEHLEKAYLGEQSVVHKIKTKNSFKPKKEETIFTLSYCLTYEEENNLLNFQYTYFCYGFMDLYLELNDNIHPTFVNMQSYYFYYKTLLET